MVFFSFSGHAQFEHHRVPMGKDGADSRNLLPLTVKLFVEKRMEMHPKTTPRALLLCVTNKFNYNFDQANMIFGKIKSYRTTLLKNIGKEGKESYGDNVKSIAEWAENNSYENVSSRPGFDIHEPFVCATDIKLDTTEPPSSQSARKTWIPKHTCRVVITSIAMVSYIPAICARGDVFSVMCFSSDTTHKIFLAKGFRLLVLFVHDATNSAKPVGISVSCNENAGDYFLLTNAVKRTVEYICTLNIDELPEGITELPFDLPSPVPAFSHIKPLSPNSSTGKLEQTCKEPIPAVSSPRYSSTASAQARNKVTDNVLYFVPTVKENQHGITFALGSAGLNITTASDGDKSIPLGLGAALPAVSNVQSECFSHLSRTLHDILSGKHRNCTGISFSADAFTSVTEEKQGKIRTTTKQKMIECVRVRIDEARFSTCRQLSLFILENLVDTLNLGGIPGYPFPQVSNQLL